LKKKSLPEREKTPTCNFRPVKEPRGTRLWLQIISTVFVSTLWYTRYKYENSSINTFVSQKLFKLFL